MATSALKAFTLGAFYLAGGTGGLLTTAADWSSPGARTVAACGIGAFAAVSGVLLLVWGRLVPSWAYHVAVAAGTGLIGAVVVLSGSHAAAVGVAGVFVFCAVDILYFFAGAPAAAQIAWLVVAVLGSLLVRGVEVGVVLAVLVVQAAVVVVVARLVARAAHGTRDSLTRLPNRRGFEERLEEAIAGARRGREGVALALVDVDYFKTVNDRDGHAAGDALLLRLAGAWTAVMPAEAVLTRHGGDEFAVLVRGRSSEDVRALVVALRRAASPTGISAGVAELAAGEGSSSLLRRADLALYAAKSAGRGCTRLADDDGGAPARDLAAAITDGAVGVDLQPVVAPATGRLVAVKALPCWCSPDHGRVPAAQLVLLAERTGMVGALGAHVLRRACRDAGRLRAALGHDVLLAVDVSGHQLVRAGFVEELVAVLAESGWRETDLVVEVTESTMEGAWADARAALEALRSLGVGVAVVAGRSALSHLDDLPVDHLTLGAAFTAEISTRPRRTATLRALLALCGELGVTVVAEGVETAEQADLLAVLGCPLVRGDHVARPAPVAELVRAVVGADPAPVVISQRTAPSRRTAPGDTGGGADRAVPAAQPSVAG